MSGDTQKIDSTRNVLYQASIFQICRHHQDLIIKTVSGIYGILVDEDTAPETPADTVLSVFTGLTCQTITELDEESLESLWHDLRSVSALVLEEHLWRLDTRSSGLTFRLQGNNNRHQEAVLVLRELPVEVDLSQQPVDDEHLRNIHTEITRLGGVCF